MSNEDPTCVLKMLKDLRSGTDAYKRSTGIPLRLSSDLSQSRTIKEDEGRASPKRAKLDDSFNSSSTDLVPKSPWEWRRLKGEMISLKARLSHQEATVEQLHKLRREMEEVFDKEKHILELQIDQDKQVINQLELRIDVGRRNLQEARDSQATAEKDLLQVKSRLEHEIAALQDENSELMRELREMTERESSMSPDKNNDEVEELQLKLEITESRVIELEAKLKESTGTEQEIELQKVEIQNLNNKIERLEGERGLWEEGMQLVSKAAKAADLEKELNLAKETIANLRESVRGKLILEEQISTLNQRMERMEQMEETVSQFQVKCIELSDRLSEYESIGFSGGPAVLKRELNRLQQAEAVLTSDEGQLRSKVEAFERKCQSLQEKCDETKKLLSDKTILCERMTKLISRTQKKMMLITRERDSYRQQLDLYEKEVTISDPNNLMAERIPSLERALEGYRELVARLETDLEVIDSGRQKEEFRKLQDEVEKLKGELEHRALKGDFNCNSRILHFRMNPQAVAEQEAEEKQKALLRELEELRAKDSTGTGGTVGTSSLHAQEIAELKQSHELKITRLKEAFKSSTQEFRQACYQLFAWKVDRTKEGMYKLSSQYAESPDDFLFFQMSNDGVNLLETPYSETLDNLIERYLKVQRSVPMFLNALQSELFEQQTVTDIYSGL
ncbi:mitotic spindle assembly checkpoint protein MAD1-like [Leptopilina heterotoma]|uniref:mitotic spindle assembly checkpoint protein MAD1-like n=1 Tax=Leptopilina heterotoma TaxID=63436 RepID=UPI001CA9DA9E|nr:mitotic spindle assembly checkpoint protein MAD1-like [Leptopilina heterotoma]